MFWSEEAPVNPSPSQETEKDLHQEPHHDSCSSIYEQYVSSCAPRKENRRVTSSGKTCQGRLVPSAEIRSDSYSRSWMSSGTVWRGVYSMRNLSEYPTGRVLDSSGQYRNAAGASSLSEVLEHQAQPKYSLSAKACAGIIRRAEQRGKPLPETLLKALQYVVVRDSSGSQEQEPRE